MKSKKLSPLAGAGLGCLIGAILSVLAIAVIMLVAPMLVSAADAAGTETPNNLGALIRVISYAPLLFAVLGYFWASRRQASEDSGDLRTRLLRALARGQSNAEIAEELKIPVQRVPVLKDNIAREWGTSSDSELLEEARKRGHLPAKTTQPGSSS